jgi:mannan endo-1,4-beta-mannosidase
MKIRYFIYFFLWSAVIFASEGNGKFQIQGSRIIDPDGTEFIPRGVNVQGMKWVWPGNIVPQADLIADAWNFNIIRVNCRMEDAFWNGQNVSVNAHYQTIESMAAIVDAFTPRKVVVMFEFHDRTGSYYSGEQLEDLKDAHRQMATLWKDNPYVWFNIMNEPGGSPANVNLWVSMHQEIIKVVRDEMQASNVIVVDAHYWGQDTGVWNADPVPEANSSILSRGTDLLNFNNKTYEDIMFSLHIYDQWNRGTPEQIEFKLHNYISRVKEKGFALMIGEFGTNRNEGDLYFPEAFKATMKVAPAHGTGLIWWHWYGGDALKLTTSGNGGGGNINHTTNPTNLTWPGKMFWDYSNHTGNTHPFVTIYQPTSVQIVNAGTNLQIKIAAEDFDDGIKEVRLYKNKELVQTFANLPYEYNLNNIEAGRYSFEAVAIDQANNETKSTSIIVNVTKSPHMGVLLFVTGSNQLTASDEALYNEMLKTGYRVIHKTQVDVREIDGSSRMGVIISSSVTQNSVGSMFLNTAVPVMVARPQFFPTMKLTGSQTAIDFGVMDNQNQVNVVALDHPVTQGITGTVNVYHQPANLGFGKPANGAEILMTTTDDAAKATLFVIPKNNMLTEGTAAAARAGWYAAADENVELTDTSLLVFTQLLQWLVQNPTGFELPESIFESPFGLKQNYPNPFHDYTTINYHTQTAGMIRIAILDQKGAIQDILINEFHHPGNYSIDFRPSGRFAKGLYYFRMEQNNETRAIPMILH